MDDANLMLIFALSFVKRMGSYGTWAHTVPSQDYDHIITFSFPHQFMLVLGKIIHPLPQKFCYNHCNIFLEVSNESLGQKKPLVF